MEKIIQTLYSAVSSDKLVKIIIAGKRRKSVPQKKVTLRPVDIKGEYMYQAEFHFDKKVTHKNIPYFEVIDFTENLIQKDFKQISKTNTIMKDSEFSLSFFVEKKSVKSADIFSFLDNNVYLMQ